MSKCKQKRAIFIVFDGGTGVGHLRRLCRIAKKLQGRFSCLIVTGHRAASHWFVPEECEYIHMPSWDNLIDNKARYWGRRPFIVLDKPGVIELRKDILNGIIGGYRPDVIFVDHLPLGTEEELSDIIKNTPCKKYYVTRGILNQTENIRKLILGGRANEYLKKYYDRILVACDQKVCDFPKKYSFSPELYCKTVHTGYVIETFSKETITKVREERGLKDNDIWVVASSGGGQLGENLMQKCIEITNSFKNIFFDIVIGPRSNIHWEHITKNVIEKDNLHLHKDSFYLPYFHASADIVISTGGYNSLLESIQGNANILCFPFRLGHKDEQYLHASYLAKFVNIEVSMNLSELPALLEKSINSSDSKTELDRRKELNFSGADNIEKIIINDLGLNI